MKLTKANFLLYCAKYYDNPQCASLEEFYEDIRRIKYIKKLFTRYENGEELKERLILNHLIVLNNVFEPEHLIKILFLKLSSQLHILTPFLLLLNLLPDTVNNVDKKNYNVDDIVMDKNVIDILRKI